VLKKRTQGPLFTADKQEGAGKDPSEEGDVPTWPQRRLKEGMDL